MWIDRHYQSTGTREREREREREDTIRASPIHTN